MPEAGGASTFVANGGFVRYCAQDATSIYYSEYSSGDLRRLDASSSTVSTLISGNSVEGFVELDQNNAYLTTSGNVQRVSKTGGPVTTLVNSGTASHAWSDGTALYYFDTATNSINSLPLTGGVPTTITPASGFCAMAVAGNSLYWSDSSKNIWKMTVPEPASMALLALGGAAMLARRRGHLGAVRRP